MSQFFNILVKRFYVISEDEDVEEVDSLDFDEADNLLNKLREEQPNKEWSLIAELDA